MTETIAERIARATAQWNPEVESRYYGIINTPDGYRLVLVRVDKTTKSIRSQTPTGSFYATHDAAEMDMIAYNGHLFRQQGF